MSRGGAASARTDAALQEQAARTGELEAELNEYKAAFDALQEQLSRQDSRNDYRQRAPGGAAPAGTLTNC